MYFTNLLKKMLVHTATRDTSDESIIKMKVNFWKKWKKKHTNIFFKTFMLPHNINSNVLMKTLPEITTVDKMLKIYHNLMYFPLFFNEYMHIFSLN